VSRRRLRSVAAGLAAALLLGAAPADRVTSQLDGYAERSLTDEFTEHRGALYAHCPYALGTYSYIELSGIRRVHRTLKLNDEELRDGIAERSELSLQPKKTRFYWNAGKRWVDWGRGPELTYIAERRGGAWTFTRDQHICAHGEPQDKAFAPDIPNG
jgi:hypothetical protein